MPASSNPQSRSASPPRSPRPGGPSRAAPGVRDADSIDSIVKAVAPKPVNVLISAPVAGLSLARLADLGVRRVSVGSALARVAWGAFMAAARRLHAGSFDGLAGAATFRELNELFRA